MTAAKFYCQRCGRVVEEVYSIEVMRATHQSPAEYEDWCAFCVILTADRDEEPPGVGDVP